MASRVVHFELAADDPERAAAFYKRVFGWEINKWSGPQDYWLVTTGEGAPGIDGGIMRRMNPSQHTTNTIQVDDLDATVSSVAAAGGSVEAPRMAIPGVGYMALLHDTEGNTFGVMQPDEAAR